MKVKINYVIWKFVLKPDGKPIYLIGGGKKIESHYCSIELDIDWDNYEDQKIIRQAISDKHPEYTVNGYCLAPNNKEEI